jgi:UDP-3-O-[3-hydroxymyristoyl] glucosamine N-acyltransferase
MNGLTLEELCGKYGCERVSSHENQTLFTGVAPLSLAGADHISFLINEKYLDDALVSGAGVILCARDVAEKIVDKTSALVLACKEPYVVFARISQFFFKPNHSFEGKSPNCHIDISANVAETAVIFPYVFIGPGAVIGPRSVLYPGTFVGAASMVGADCILYPNVVVREGCVIGDRCILNPGAVLGGDGFGFAPSGMENVKIPQIGGVVLENDVEVGANSAIDRGALTDTRIGKQTKLDSLVMIAHNVVVGEACFIAAQTGIAGSSVIGKRVTLAGQVGVSGHVKVGDFITVLAQAGVSKSLESPGYYNGTPARTNKDYLMQLATLSRLAGSKRPGAKSTKENASE